MRTHQKSAIGFLAIIALAAASFGSVPDSSAMWGPMTGGLVGRYYDNITGASPHVEIQISTLKLTRPDDNINFSWSGGAPDPSIGSDTFGVIWTGYLTIPADGTNWQIGLMTDDGSRVWIDEIPLSFGSPPSVVGADINWKAQAAPAEPLWSTLVSPSPLGPGPHTLRVEYYEGGVGATAKVWWKSSTQAKEIISATAFTHCVGDSVCDDSNPCTVDRCGAERENYGFCVHTPAASGTVCRGAAGACDVAETCSGASTVCPSDTFVATGTVCRGAMAACDATEVCTGSNALCPADGMAAAGTVCRSAAGVCDVAEACTGVSVHCPTDGIAAAGTVCRAAAGACDVAEACTGISMHCPTDGVAAKETVCRGVAGPCDVAEVCNGANASCPTDTFVAAGTTCRAVRTTGCDVSDTCSGTSAVCVDVVAPDGLTCGSSKSPGSCRCGQCCGPTIHCLDVQCPNPI